MAGFDPDAYLAASPKAAFDPDSYLSQGKKEEAPKPNKKAEPIGPAGKLLKGAVDPIEGGAQLLTNVLPESWVNAGNRLNNKLADMGLPVARIPDGGMNQLVQQNEADYQARRRASEPQSITGLVTGQQQDPGFDWWRLGGNILSPANLALARLPAATSTFGRVASGSGAGAASAALNPVTQGGDYWGQKQDQVALGGITGGMVPAVIGATSRIISPKASTNSAVAALRSEGVRPTVGQTLGGFANTVEEKATSLPIVGDMIASARRGAAGDLNQAAFNRALAPVNGKLPKGMAGREAVQFTEDAISSGYNKLLPSLVVKADKAFSDEVQNLRGLVKTGAMDPNSAKAFERIVQNDVMSKFRGQSALTGETFKAIESDLGNQIKRFSISQDADQRLVGDALQELQSSMRKMLQRSNPDKAQELGKLNTAWANFKRVQRASASLGAEDGIFSPAQLQSAVKALDRSKDKSRFAKGNALMQDLSEAGKSVLGNKVPDSGTAGRLFMGGGAAAGSFLDPTGFMPASIAGGSLAYTRPVQNALTFLLTQRPQAAQAVANALRQSTPALVPAAAQVSTNLLR